MKKLVCILLMLLCVMSCNKGYAPEHNKTADMELEVTSESELIEFSKINNYEALSAQKLNEYFDLLKLKSSHPDFKRDIQEQLMKYTSESLIEFDLGDNFKIENIHQIGREQNISDSVIKVQLQFDLIIGSIQFKDSVYANITSKVINVDGDVLKTNKVKFSRE